ncbi:MAG: hypothetical protein ACOH2D_06230 [Gelidibacter sp.]
MKNFILINFIIILFSTISLSAQEKQKDTLYFDYSENYILIYDVTPNKIYIVDSSDDGTFFFEKIDIKINKDPKEILCLEKYIRSSKYYDKHKKVRLNDYRLAEPLDNYTIYLVKKTNNKVEYIHVQPNFEIE